MTVLLKTLYLLSSVGVHMYIINNDVTIYYDILEAVRAWHSEAEARMVFHHVELKYPAGMEYMAPMFRMCATARLFIDFMVPDVDAGIFLDTDTLLMDDIKVLLIVHLGKSSKSQLFTLRNSGDISGFSIVTRWIKHLLDE